MNNDWLDIDVLEDYLDGKLDSKTMHFVERQALEDPFVAEALEGLSQSPKRRQHLSILQKQLQERLVQKPIKRKLWGINTQRLSIAATATVAFIAVSILFILRETNRRNNEIAQRKNNGVVVNLDTTTAIASVPEAKADTARQQDVITGALAQIKKPDLKNAPVIAKNSNSTVRASSVKAKQAITQAAPVMVVSGKIVEKNSGHPLPGADVKIAGTDIGTTADSNGRYTLKLDSTQKDKTIQVASIGYNTEQLPVNLVKQGEAIALTQSGNSLNEVAITAAGVAKKETAYSTAAVRPRALEGKVQGIQISGGAVAAENYEEYIAKNNRLTPNGLIGKQVVLTFKVDHDGSPKDIKIVDSASDQQNQEAIRLVAEGPKWKKVKDGADTVRLIIKF